MAQEMGPLLGGGQNLQQTLQTETTLVMKS
jgi:hypothetical protein